MCTDSADRPAVEMETTRQMIEAGVAAFWDFMGDRDFPVTYDAAPFVRHVFERMALAQVGRTVPAASR